jgi:SpoVK/Ycf46/Vps4 family AAA+-type ATPase
MLEDCVSRGEDADVDLARVAGATRGMTAADIGEVWNRAAQRAFERELTGLGADRVTTDDLLAAAETHRPSLRPDDVAVFERQVREFARV